jgi:hypothetical protein
MMRGAWALPRTSGGAVAGSGAALAGSGGALAAGELRGAAGPRAWSR